MSEQAEVTVRSLGRKHKQTALPLLLPLVLVLVPLLFDVLPFVQCVEQGKTASPRCNVQVKISIISFMSSKNLLFALNSAVEYFVSLYLPSSWKVWAVAVRKDAIVRKIFFALCKLQHLPCGHVCLSFFSSEARWRWVWSFASSH